MFLKFFGLYTKKQLREAQDAILELSAIQSDMLAQLYTAKDVGFDAGYTMAAQRCAKLIRAMKSGSNHANQIRT